MIPKTAFAKIFSMIRHEYQKRILIYAKSSQPFDKVRQLGVIMEDLSVIQKPAIEYFSREDSSEFLFKIAFPQRDRVSRFSQTNPDLALR